MKDISFIRYSPHISGSSITSQVVECYRQVFADGPWHEWKQCPKCKKYWGIKDHQELEKSGFQHCNMSLSDFWPREQVTEDLFHEITEESSCWLALYESRVIGFCWGYPITLEYLEKKLGLSLNLTTWTSLGQQIQIAYQDEVGVLSEFRGRKIAKTMVKHRLLDFLAKGLNVGIVRTREYPEPSETFLWYQRLGYETVARYTNGDGRVILARNLEGLSSML
jgi:GNAT superfamily N-acetyltransferase